MIDPNKVVVVAALSGGGTPKGNVPGGSPYLPITPEEIAAEAKRAYEAGASIVHIHARDPKTTWPFNGGEGAENNRVFKEYIAAIEATCPEVIINITTGGGPTQSYAERLEPVKLFKPLIASYTGGGLTNSRYSKKEQTFLFDYATSMFMSTMTEYADTFKEAGTKAECEIYDFGHMNLVHMIQDRFAGKIMLQFVMGMSGQSTKPTIPNLVRLVETAKELFGDKNFLWGACAAGSSQWGILSAAAFMGSTTIRAGLEDNVYIEPGVLAKSNGELIEKAVSIARGVGREIASAEETKEILGLKKSRI